VQSAKAESPKEEAEEVLKAEEATEVEWMDAWTGFFGLTGWRGWRYWLVPEEQHYRGKYSKADLAEDCFVAKLWHLLLNATFGRMAKHRGTQSYVFVVACLLQTASCCARGIWGRGSDWFMQLFSKTSAKELALEKQIAADILEGGQRATAAQRRVRVCVNESGRFVGRCFAQNWLCGDRCEWVCFRKASSATGFPLTEKTIDVCCLYICGSRRALKGGTSPRSWVKHVDDESEYCTDSQCVECVDSAVLDLCNCVGSVFSCAMLFCLFAHDRPDRNVSSTRRESSEGGFARAQSSSGQSYNDDLSEADSRALEKRTPGLKGPGLKGPENHLVSGDFLSSPVVVSVEEAVEEVFREFLSVTQDAMVAFTRTLFRHVYVFVSSYIVLTQCAVMIVAGGHSAWQVCSEAWCEEESCRRYLGVGSKAEDTRQRLARELVCCSSSSGLGEFGSGSESCWLCDLRRSLWALVVEEVEAPEGVGGAGGAVAARARGWCGWAYWSSCFRVWCCCCVQDWLGEMGEPWGFLECGHRDAESSEKASEPNSLTLTGESGTGSVKGVKKKTKGQALDKSAAGLRARFGPNSGKAAQLLQSRFRGKRKTQLQKEQEESAKEGDIVSGHGAWSSSSFFTRRRSDLMPLEMSDDETNVSDAGEASDTLVSTCSSLNPCTQTSKPDNQQPCLSKPDGSASLLKRAFSFLGGSLLSGVCHILSCFSSSCGSCFRCVPCGTVWDGCIYGVDSMCGPESGFRLGGWRLIYKTVRKICCCVCQTKTCDLFCGNKLYLAVCVKVGYLLLGTYLDLPRLNLAGRACCRFQMVRQNSATRKEEAASETKEEFIGENSEELPEVLPWDRIYPCEGVDGVTAHYSPNVPTMVCFNCLWSPWVSPGNFFSTVGTSSSSPGAGKTRVSESSTQNRTTTIESGPFAVMMARLQPSMRLGTCQVYCYRSCAAKQAEALRSCRDAIAGIVAAAFPGALKKREHRGIRGKEADEGDQSGPAETGPDQNGPAANPGAGDFGVNSAQGPGLWSSPKFFVGLFWTWQTLETTPLAWILETKNCLQQRVWAPLVQEEDVFWLFERFCVRSIDLALSANAVLRICCLLRRLRGSRSSFASDSSVYGGGGEQGDAVPSFWETHARFTGDFPSGQGSQKLQEIVRDARTAVTLRQVLTAAWEFERECERHVEVKRGLSSGGKAGDDSSREKNEGGNLDGLETLEASSKNDAKLGETLGPRTGDPDSSSEDSFRSAKDEEESTSEDSFQSAKEEASSEDSFQSAKEDSFQSAKEEEEEVSSEDSFQSARTAAESPESASESDGFSNYDSAGEVFYDSAGEIIARSEEEESFDEAHNFKNHIWRVEKLLLEQKLVGDLREVVLENPEGLEELLGETPGAHLPQRLSRNYGAPPPRLPKTGHAKNGVLWLHLLNVLMRPLHPSLILDPHEDAKKTALLAPRAHVEAQRQHRFQQLTKELWIEFGPVWEESIFLFDQSICSRIVYFCRGFL